MREEFAEAHPLIQLLIIFVLGFFFMTVMVFLTAIPFAVFGGGLKGLIATLSGNVSDSSGIVMLKVMQITQSIGLFIVPFLIYRYYGKQKSYPINVSRNGLLPLLIFGATMACAFPLVNWLAILNSNLHLPEFLSGVEDWIYQTEASAEALIKQFLYMESVGDLIFNLILIALVPAIAEELCFRGAVQPAFMRLVKNKHAAVWITAFVFSFIHLQFLGFLPRFILGAVLGYAAWWSNSLIVPMTGHFVNNGLAVMAAWYLGEASLESDYAFFETDRMTLYYALASLVLVVGGMLIIHNIRPKKEMVEFRS